MTDSQLREFRLTCRELRCGLCVMGDELAVTFTTRQCNTNVRVDIPLAVWDTRRGLWTLPFGEPVPCRDDAEATRLLHAALRAAPRSVPMPGRGPAVARERSLKPQFRPGDPKYAAGRQKGRRIIRGAKPFQ